MRLIDADKLKEFSDIGTIIKTSNTQILERGGNNNMRPYTYEQCGVPDLTNEEKSRIDKLYKEKRFLNVAGMVIELSREVKSLKESKDTKADMNNKLHDENEELRQQLSDLEWKVENLEDEKGGLEKEIQLGNDEIAKLNDEIAQLNDELNRIKKAAAVQGRENRKLRTANEALNTAAQYWRKESRNTRHYVKKLERIITELLGSEE